VLCHLSDSFHAPKNKVAHLNRLQLHHTTVQACDAEFIESFSKESITADRREEVEGFMECCIVQLLLEIYQPVSVKSDLNR